MTARELVTDGDLTALGNVYAYHAVHASGQLVAVASHDFTHRSDDAVFTVGHTQRGVTHFAGLLTEDGAQQALFTGQLGFTLRSDLTNQDVTAVNLSTDADNAALV